MSLGEKIYNLRTNMKMSQGDLADALDVSRQSVSKWETDASVPDLDKLVKLSELFSVSLDELVLDRKQNVAAPNKSNSSCTDAAFSGRKIIGVILLCFSVLLWLIVALLGDFLAGIIMASPLLACGLICLLLRRHIGLFCCWTIYLFVSLYLRFGTGISWSYILVPQVYTDALSAHVIISWAILVAYLKLTVVTVHRFQRSPVGTLKSNILMTAILWAAYCLALIIVALPLIGEMVEVKEIMTYRFFSSAVGWLRELLFAAAIVYTVRLVRSLWECRNACRK